MSETNPTFEDKRHALCWCCGGWQNASRQDIETRWGQLPPARAKSYLHRFKTMQAGTAEQKKQAEKFIQSLPEVNEVQGDTPVIARPPKSSTATQPPKKADPPPPATKAADNESSSSA